MIHNNVQGIDPIVIILPPSKTLALSTIMPFLNTEHSLSIKALVCTLSI